MSLLSVTGNLDQLHPIQLNPNSHKFQRRFFLLLQIVRPVKWEQMLHVLYQRREDDSFPRTFECGPGRGLTTILKQVNAKAWDNAYNIDT